MLFGSEGFAGGCGACGALGPTTWPACGAGPVGMLSMSGFKLGPPDDIGEGVSGTGAGGAGIGGAMPLASSLASKSLIFCLGSLLSGCMTFLLAIGTLPVKTGVAGCSGSAAGSGWGAGIGGSGIGAGVGADGSGAGAGIEGSGIEDGVAGIGGSAAGIAAGLGAAGAAGAVLAAKSFIAFANTASSWLACRATGAEGIAATGSDVGVGLGMAGAGGAGIGAAWVDAVLLAAAGASSPISS